MEKKKIRITAIGDELLAGIGDQKALGWIGRILKKTNKKNIYSIETFILPAPYEGTDSLSHRWFAEAKLRFDHYSKNKLIISLSSKDLDLGLSIVRSKLNLANILDQAIKMNISTLVIGPPPNINSDYNVKLVNLNNAFFDVIKRRNIIYIDIFTPLLSYSDWFDDLVRNNGFPSHIGYSLIAWIILNRGWFSWLDQT